MTKRAPIHSGRHNKRRTKRSGRDRRLAVCLTVCFGGINSTGMWIGSLAFTGAVSGCSSENTAEIQQVPKRPLRKFRSAARRQQWPQAWQYSDSILTIHQDDPDVIMEVAFVAQKLGETERVAELLEQACRVESFQNGARLQRSTIAMIAVGRLYDATDLLEAAVIKYPARHTTRRWLYDLYLNSGNTEAGQIHGRTLVRQRHFDQQLLLSLDGTEQPIEELESAEEMAQRNPSDKRPLLRSAKSLYQRGEFGKATEVISQIVDQHPSFVPAQGLLGRCLAASGQWESLNRWEQSQKGQLTSKLADYWLAKADAAVARDESLAAIRHYWEAGQLNPSLREPWEKMVALMRDQDVGEPELIAAISDRAVQIRSLQSTKDQFDRLGGISRELAIKIAQHLVQLGRLWEAESWASLATTLPPDEAVDVEKVRNQIVGRLTDQTPWQITSGHQELQKELPRSLR